MSGGIQSVQPFLEALAARTPTPGGGGAAAVCGALATALAEMVAAYSVRPNTEPMVRESITAISVGLSHSRALLMGLAQEDGAAYEAMTSARKKARAGKDPASEMELRAAVVVAATAPLQIAAAASAALGLMEELAPNAGAAIASDLGAAAEMALAASHAAAYSVRANLSELQPDDRRAIETELRSVLSHADASAAAIRAKIAPSSGRS